MYFEFTGKIEFKDMYQTTYHVIYLPQHIIEELPLKENPRLRVEGEFNEEHFNLSLHPQKGRWYLVISKKYLKKLDLMGGDRVDVYFRIADQNHVDVPEELTSALEKSAKNKKLWDQLTIGKKRSFSHMINNAKLPETKKKRVSEVLKALKS